MCTFGNLRILAFAQSSADHYRPASETPFRRADSGPLLCAHWALISIRYCALIDEYLGEKRGPVQEYTLFEPPSKHRTADHHPPASKTPFEYMLSSLLMTGADPGLTGKEVHLLVLNIP